MFLSDDYKIKIDERNVVLEHLVRPVELFKKVDGVKVSKGMSKGHWEVIGYYNSHQALLRAFVNLEIREVPQEVNEILGKIDELYALIEGLPISYVYQCNHKKPKEDSDD